MTLKFMRQCTSILATQVDAPALFLFTAQIASKCGSEFTNLAYDFYVQAFSMCEDSLGIGCAACSDYNYHRHLAVIPSGAPAPAEVLWLRTAM
ncbi:hypothetical protein PISMIDRAFT_20007 [Pisolithus microcarpus 441]|uniref:Uncharacterized protein n=1 Tax=Pisolithus microcarpus 441 TaxID=765257 RepID=A0A0C9XF08_9AGAM|nr:hypothetical protein PISMIDRAFT_20007 [Pisolithus microcarpus 441]